MRPARNGTVAASRGTRDVVRLRALRCPLPNGSTSSSTAGASRSPARRRGRMDTHDERRRNASGFSMTRAAIDSRSWTEPAGLLHTSEPDLPHSAASAPRTTSEAFVA
jgi:hypothetical protein